MFDIFKRHKDKKENNMENYDEYGEEREQRRQKHMNKRQQRGNGGDGDARRTQQNKRFMCPPGCKIIKGLNMPEADFDALMEIATLRNQSLFTVAREAIKEYVERNR